MRISFLCFQYGRRDWACLVCLLLLTLCGAVIARGQGAFHVDAHVFAAGYSPPAVGSATVQANVALAQNGLTGQQQYGTGERLLLGFLAALPHRDSDGDGIADPYDSDSDGDGEPDVSDSRPYDADADGANNLNDADDDNDGQTDLEESVAGTDPLDAASLFYIGSINVLPGGDVQLRWQGVRSRAYTVYAASNLTAALPWSPLGTTNATADAPLTLTLPDPQSEAFYRLGVSRR